MIRRSHVTLSELAAKVPKREAGRRELLLDAANAIRRLAGREVNTYELRPAILEQFRQWLIGAGLKHFRFKQFCLLWKEANVQGYVESPPPKYVSDGIIRTIRFPHVKPLSEVSADELDQLIEAAVKIFRRFSFFRNGISKAAYWECALRLGYEMKLHLRQLSQLTFADADFSASTYQPRRGERVLLSRDSIEAIRVIQRPRRELILPPLRGKRTLLKQYRRIALTAGLMRRHTAGQA